eukprot:947445-Prorocentrum_lima.AAC.1
MKHDLLKEVHQEVHSILDCLLENIVGLIPWVSLLAMSEGFNEPGDDPKSGGMAGMRIVPGACMGKIL